MNVSSAPAAPAVATPPASTIQLPLFDIKRPGFLRPDSHNYRAGYGAGAAEGYIGLENAVDAAKQLMEPSSPSLVVLEEGDRFAVRKLENLVFTQEPHGWNWVEARMPALENRDTFQNVNASLAAIVTQSDVITRERIDAPAQ